MKFAILFFVLILGTNSIFASVRKTSLETLTAKNCRKIAIKYALDKAGEDWIKNGVSLLHLDRSIPYGEENDSSKGEMIGYSNVSVVISRESADPVQFEMLIQGRSVKGSSRLNCKVIKESQRELL